MQPLPKKLQDFRYFLIVTWRHLNLPDPTPVQLDIAEYLQYGARRKIIQGFRGVGKSWITSTYVVWRLRINPARIGISFIRRIVKVVKLSARSLLADTTKNFSCGFIRSLHTT